MLGIIIRLTVQKGIHLNTHVIHRTLERNGQVLPFSCSGIAGLLCFIYAMFIFLRTEVCLPIIGGFTGFCIRSSHIRWLHKSILPIKTLRGRLPHSWFCHSHSELLCVFIPIPMRPVCFHSHSQLCPDPFLIPNCIARIATKSLLLIKLAIVACLFVFCHSAISVVHSTVAT
jgi:hypothetical protein